jgi:hypothetical protein
LKIATKTTETALKEGVRASLWRRGRRRRRLDEKNGERFLLWSLTASCA